MSAYEGLEVSLGDMRGSLVFCAIKSNPASAGGSRGNVVFPDKVYLGSTTVTVDAVGVYNGATYKTQATIEAYALMKDGASLLWYTGSLTKEYGNNNIMYWRPVTIPMYLSAASSFNAAEAAARGYKTLDAWVADGYLLKDKLTPTVIRLVD